MKCRLCIGLYNADSLPFIHGLLVNNYRRFVYLQPTQLAKYRQLSNADT